MLFPLGKETEHYLGCINTQIYSNLLLSEWQKRQTNERQLGIELLKKLCIEEFHVTRRVYTESSSESNDRRFVEKQLQTIASSVVEQDGGLCDNPHSD